MATTLPAGSVAIGIIGKDINFQQIINQSTQSIENFQQTIQNGITEMPGFQGILAYFRDFTATLAAVDQLARRTWGIFKAAVTEFSDFGDSVAKMSRRTGIGAHDLSLLGFAAEQSGTSLADVGNGMRYLNRNLAEAGRGNKTALDAFGQLGINLTRFQTLGKKDQFLEVAEAIRQIGDETLQTDAAMKFSGAAGLPCCRCFRKVLPGLPT